VEVYAYRLGGGNVDPPVQLDIVDFPRGQDVFNPKFWDGLRCPSVAVHSSPVIYDLLSLGM